LRLLTAANLAGHVQEITPTWKRPRTDILPPTGPGMSYLIDLSEQPESPPTADLGAKFLAWAQEKSVHIVVTTTDEPWVKPWAASAGDAVIQLSSPNARALAESEIRSANAPERVSILGDRAFDDIWASAPKAEDACRLARLIISRPEEEPKDIANEYSNWRTWIDQELSTKDLPQRTLIWSAAFCDGGSRKSILRMSEDLRRLLGEQRGPAEILKDAPASQRLKDAWIEASTSGEGMALLPARHGLPAAFRAYLWEEYEDSDLREKLCDWIGGQLGRLPLDDSERVMNGILDVAVSYRDDTLLRTIRDKLTNDRRSLAVYALSAAAIDPRFGAHVRASLYRWATANRDQRVIDLVAEVCGSTFGERMPGMALVRLGWAAQKSQPGSRALARALAALAGHHPDEVLASLSKWFSDFDPPTAGVNGFLALASTENGATLLGLRAQQGTTPGAFRDRLVYYFERALEGPDSKIAAYTVLKLWEKYVGTGLVDEDTAIQVLGRSLAPRVKDNVFWQLVPHKADFNSFWGRIFTIAIHIAGMETGVSIP
jgi:hypothetical protein